MLIGMTEKADRITSGHTRPRRTTVRAHVTWHAHAVSAVHVTVVATRVSCSLTCVLTAIADLRCCHLQPPGSAPALLCTDQSGASTSHICRQLTPIHHLGRATRWRTERQLRLSQSKSFSYAESNIHFKSACWKGWSLCGQSRHNRTEGEGRQGYSYFL